MRSPERTLLAAIDSALHEADLRAKQTVPGQWRVEIVPTWSAALAVSYSAKHRSVRPVFLVFSDRIQTLIDRTLGRPHNTAVATLMFTPSWANRFLSDPGDLASAPDQHLVHQDDFGDVVRAVVQQFRGYGLPVAERLSSLEAVIDLLRDDSLGEICLPVDYVASCALLLAHQRAEAVAYVERRVAELSSVTTDAELEPFLRFGPRVLTAYEHDA